MKVDDMDLDIIRHLWNGRKSYREIGKSLGITTNTVRTRVSKMVEAGALQIIGLVEPKVIHGHTTASIAFKVEPGKADKILDKISRLKGVVAVACVTGQFDIIADVLFNETHTYEKFIFEEIPKIDGIKSVETSFIIKAINRQLRYVL
ncbi:Lrp/AsnC family transcriptional regulator [bacterium]|nr:Lrp/AsnC family transcriptional regulator [bacterium]